jgi:hypothetical protein
MRILVSVCAVLAVASGTLSALLWRNLNSERQVSPELRGQLDAARAELAARPVVQITVPAPAPSIESAPPAPEKATPERTTAAIAEVARRQKTLMADSEYRKARMEQARINLRQRYAALAQQLGISPQQMDKVIDILAESELRTSDQAAELVANGMPTDQDAIVEMQRLAEQYQQQLKTDVVALIGEDAYNQLQEFEQTQPSRTRVNNLTTLLARAGHPMTPSQTQSLTRLIVAEQKRMDAESQAFANVGVANPKPPAERQAETNRNILQAASAFLDSQQLELMRGRFQQRATIDTAADRVQQREREVIQQGTGQ